jgi:hypothetical protein
MRSLLKLETEHPSSKLISILHYNGLPIPSECVVQGVTSRMSAEAAA